MPNELLPEPYNEIRQIKRDYARQHQEWPREESNLRTRIRSPSLYPLSYGARLRGWRMGLEPTTTWNTTRGSTN
jgi:hypothetical protein